MFNLHIKWWINLLYEIIDYTNISSAIFENGRNKKNSELAEDHGSKDSCKMNFKSIHIGRWYILFNFKERS